MCDRHRSKSILILTVLVLLLLMTASVSSAAQSEPFPRAPRGEAAIAALGDRLPAVARAYGLTAGELADLFRSDHTLSVDQGGELYYIDIAFPGDAALSALAASSPELGPYPNDQTFLLESLPGADHTIYLDFDGHVTTGTTWNSSYGVDPIVSPPYDIDGNPAAFSQSEIDIIQYTWQIVAEDFAPFDINVTTRDPGSAALRYTGGGDTQWGTRVVITDDTFANCGCGGHAYIGSFDDPQDEPVFVYNTSEVGVSEASSHEVGHAMLLSHDGTLSGVTYYQGHGSGETDWAPIMGVGYYANVTQWDKGEYYNSNNGGPNANYGNGPDDLAIISALNNGNGFGYRVDDHGNNNAGASALALANFSVNDGGIIERTTDVDVFSFTTGAGNVSLSIQPYLRQPNLDVLAELYNSGGGLVATSNPAALVSASLNLTLAAGTYYLHIDGVGVGNPAANPPTGYTDYGSLGQYTITGTIVDPGGNQPPVAVASANPTSGQATLTVNFDGSGSDDPDGTIVSYGWDFGDGNTGSGSTTSHQYTSAGVYTAILTVIDDGGFSDTDNVTITVTEPPPAAPGNLVATAVSESAIDLTWDDNAGNESGFRVERSPDGAAWGQIATVGADVTAYSDSGLNHSTAYYYRLYAYNGTGNSAYSNIANATTDSPPPTIDQSATGDVPVAGTVTGSYTLTEEDDGNAQAITERESGGKPSSRYDYLEHRWSFNLQAGSSHTFYVNAWRTELGDGDDFAFAYSANGGPFVNMVTVTASGDGVVESYFLPANLSGSVTIRVTDTNSTAGNKNLDTVFVDWMAITTVTNPQLVGTVSGTVTANDTSSPIEGATVTADSGQSTTTAVDGSYTLIDVPIGSRTITATADGYLSQEQLTEVTNGGTSVVNFSLVTAPPTITMHVGDLDAGTTLENNGKWNIMLTITVHDVDHNPIANVTVTGSWGDGEQVSCVTNNAGQCPEPITKNNINRNTTSMTFTVEGLSHATYVPNLDANHDPDGDSDGTIITVSKPTG